MRATLLIYHLICLTIHTNIPSIEALAKDPGLSSRAHEAQAALLDPEHALVHAGQILRLVRHLPRGVRPLWWSAAVYRAALVFWAASLAFERAIHSFSRGSFSSSQALPWRSGTETKVRLDQLEPRDPAVCAYLKKREGAPVLSGKEGDVGLESADKVLEHCIGVVEEDALSAFEIGVGRRLKRYLAASS